MNTGKPGWAQLNLKNMHFINSLSVSNTGYDTSFPKQAQFVNYDDYLVSISNSINEELMYYSVTSEIWRL